MKSVFTVRVLEVERSSTFTFIRTIEPNYNGIIVSYEIHGFTRSQLNESADILYGHGGMCVYHYITRNEIKHLFPL